MSPSATASGSTPLVDRYLLNPLRVPIGVAEWLRRAEQDLRTTQKKLVEVRLKAFDFERSLTRVFLESSAELDNLLSDTDANALARLLSRPLWQLAGGSPARLGFERRSSDAIRRAAGAIEVQLAVDAIAVQLHALRWRGDQIFPGLYDAECVRLQLTESAVVSARRLADVNRFSKKLRLVEEKLISWERSLSRATNWQNATRVDGEMLVAAEMHLLMILNHEHRAMLSSSRVSGRHLSSVLASHVAATAESGRPPTTPEGTSSGLFAQELLQRAVRLGRLSEFTADDAPLWAAILASTRDYSLGISGQLAAPPSITPHLETKADAPADASATAGSQLYVVPLEHGLLHLTPDPASCIRVWSAEVQLGGVIQAQIIAAGIDGRSPIVQSDLAALFDGFDASTTRWYRTQSRVQIRIVAKGDAGWFGRIERRGSVEIIKHPPWKSEAPTVTAFRVLREAGARNAGRPRKVVSLVGDVPTAPSHSFFGYTTREVRTAIPGHERAWLREIESAAIAPMERAVANEALLFEAMYRSGESAASALRPIGRGKSEGRHAESPLYGIPFASEVGLRGLALAWVEQRVTTRLALIGSVARLVDSVHRCGWVLGLVHPHAFCYSIGWGARANTPIPKPMLAHAPCAVRLGEKFDVLAMSCDAAGGDYQRLKVPTITPIVAASGVASFQSDWYAFAVCALELLAQQPLDNGSSIDHFDLASIVRARASRFVDAELARALASSLLNDPTGGRVFDAFKQLQNAGSLFRGDLLARL